MADEHKKDEVTDQPVYWFVVLEQARQGSDFELAAQAVRELKRLGVVVRFEPEPAHA